MQTQTIPMAAMVVILSLAVLHLLAVAVVGMAHLRLPVVVLAAAVLVVEPLRPEREHRVKVSLAAQAAQEMQIQLSPVLAAGDQAQ